MKDKLERFIEKRQFAIPLETFVEIDIPENTRSKILQWIENGDVIGIYPYATGLSRLVLINETKFKRSKQKRKK